MADKTMDLYLIQSPDVVPDNGHGNKDVLSDLLIYYRGTPIVDGNDFVKRVIYEWLIHRRKIRRLVIGSHGFGNPVGGGGNFYLGETVILYGMDDFDDKMNRYFKPLAGFFARDADVFIIACQTGNSDKLLQSVSRALGGVRVHGYTDYITTTNYLLVTTVDDGTDDEGSEIVCWPSICRYWGGVVPKTKTGEKHPVYKSAPQPYP